MLDYLTRTPYNEDPSVDFNEACFEGTARNSGNCAPDALQTGRAGLGLHSTAPN